jgi:PAS domain S-box-containing protein
MVGVMLENPSGMFICWGDAYTQLYNDGFRPILGTLKHPKALGASAAETFSEIWDTIGPIFADVLQGNPVRISDFEVQMNRHGYLETCYFDFSCSPIRLENGEVGGILGTIYEVSGKKKAELALQESKDQLKFAIEAAELGTWEFNPQSRTLTGNEQFKKWFGINDPNEIEPQHVLNGIAVQDRDRIVTSIQKALNHHFGGICHEEFSILHPVTKKETIVRAKGRTWFTDEKTAYRFTGVLEDVTEEVVSQRLVKESEVFNKAILESSPDCVKVLDQNGVITFINLNGVCLLEGENKEFFLDRNWSTLWDDHTKPAITNAINQGLQGKSSHFGAGATTVKGTQKWWDVFVTPIFDIGGNVVNVLATSRDITEQVMSSKKIEESELRFRQLADQAPMWVWMADEHVNVVYANHQLLDFIGIADVSQFTGHVWERMVHPDYIQLVYNSFRDASISKEAFSFEFQIKNAKTAVFEWFYVKAVPRFESGNFAGFIGTALNIQEQRATLSLLEYRTALLEAFNESSNDGILLVDTKGAIISYNRCFVEIWDMPEHIVNAKDDKAALEFAITQLESPEKFMDTIEVLYSHPDQKSKDELHFKNGKIIERHGFPVIAKDGSFYAWSWIFRDITDLKKTTSALKESEETFRQLSELMPEKVSRTDGEGNAVYFNQSWMDYTGFSFEELRNWGWEKVVHPDELEGLRLQWSKSLASGQNFEMEFRLLNRNGEYRWHLCRSNPLRDETGKINNWLGAVTEIQKIKEEEQRKGDFIKMVSHELKTPVTSVKGYVQLLLSMLYSDPEVNMSSIPFKPTLERVDKQISRLTRLITEMLDLSRLEESKLELEKEPFDLNTLVKETIQDLQHISSSHHISFIQNFRARISGDRDRIQQVLINFINNAIKYSPDKKLVKVIIRETENNQVSVSVKDFGIGINKLDQEKVFERFYRVTGKKETTFSGFGIGLYIAKEIIERHQGTISVESKKGQGATFSFSLPVLN